MLVAFTGVETSCRSSRSAVWAGATAALAFAQIALGIVMAYVSLAPAAQVAHLTVASLLLGAEMVLLLLLRSGTWGLGPETWDCTKPQA